MNGDRHTSRVRQICRLEKDGRYIAFLLKDLQGGSFELKLMRSDIVTPSVGLFRIREEALAEANRQLQHYIADGWMLETEDIL